MDFRNAKEIADIWSSSDKTDFELILADDKERKLLFSYGTVSFYVLCPDPKAEPEDINRWHVWSDCDEVLTHLVEVQDFLDSCQRSLTEILNKVNKALQPVLGHAGAQSDDDNFDEDFDEAYYEEEDTDAKAEEFKHHSSSEEEEVCEYFTGNANPTGVHRLLKDLKNMKKADGKFGVHGSPRGNNLFTWDVKLIDLPKETPLGQDILKYSQKYKEEAVIHLEMKFPDDFPMAPPFVRILKPRFKFLTGHVTIGGSICMEMLTRSGWAPTNDIEGILVQIRAEILSDPSTRLATHNSNQPYDEVEAKQAFQRMVQKYGWEK